MHMFGPEQCGFSFWWIVPVLMMLLCFFMIRGGRRSMMCGFGTRRGSIRQQRSSDSAMDILDKRLASGEINREEYEEKKIMIAGPTESFTE